MRLLSGEPSVKFDGLLTLPMHHTLSMLASLSVTLLVSFIFRELFARGAIRDCWRCFVVIGQDDTGRFLVKSGMKPISGPMIDQEPEGPALADGREAGTGADVRTPVCLPEAANMEFKGLKPDSPELSTNSFNEEYRNHINRPKPSKPPSVRPSKIDGNDKIDGGVSKKASKASNPVRRKASTSSVGKKSARPSRITTPRSKSLKKRLAKSGQVSVQ